MSMISKEGYEQIKIIKNALDSMYEKLDKIVYTKIRPTRNEDVNYKDILVTTGASEAILFTINSCLDNNDEIVAWGQWNA